MLFNEIFFENLPIRTQKDNKGRPDSRTNPGGLLYIIRASMPCSHLLVISPTQFSQTSSSELTDGEMTSSMHQGEVRPRSRAMGIFQGQGWWFHRSSTSNYVTEDHFIRKQLSLSSFYHLDVI